MKTKRLTLIDGRGDLFASWNTAEDDVVASLGRAGYSVLSVYGAALVVRCCNEVYTVRGW